MVLTGKPVVHDVIELAGGRTVTAAELRAALRYGEPPSQPASISRDAARARSSTAELWPVFHDGSAEPHRGE